MGGKNTNHKRLSNNKRLWSQADQEMGDELPGQSVGQSRDGCEWPKQAAQEKEVDTGRKPCQELGAAIQKAERAGGSCSVLLCVSKAGKKE